MSETIAVSALAALITVLLAMLGYIVALLISLNRRIRVLERRDHLNWLYIQSLISHAYKHLATPLPLPPEGWQEFIE